MFISNALGYFSDSEHEVPLHFTPREWHHMGGEGVETIWLLRRHVSEQECKTASSRIGVVGCGDET